MAMSSKLLVLAAAALPLAGCASLDPVTGSVDRHFGEAVAWNKEVQVINPDGTPARPGAAQPGGSGDVAAGASQRYRTDRVKQIEQVGTTQGGGAAGGGAGPQ
jgi:hypothetical protein